MANAVTQREPIRIIRPQTSNTSMNGIQHSIS
jgi:hypothetical protein